MKRLGVVLFCLALHAQAETFGARVIAVMDGDTVMVLRQGQKIKIRLANIDAPEKDQAFGMQSRDSLLQMLGGKRDQIDSLAADQYGRTVALVSADGRDVNQEQVRRGMAWEYSHYHADNTYVALQREAQQAHRGLWAQASPQAPWLWRKHHPSSLHAPQAGQYGASRTTPTMFYDAGCGRKRRCSQMASCDEAYFYFTYCGVATLDGNHDGRPCENLCGGSR